MLRALCTSALSILLLLTLQWGGCISCPQFFMFSTPKAAATKDCCSKGQCERSSKDKTSSLPANECRRMPLELQDHATCHLIELGAADVTDGLVSMSLAVKVPLEFHRFDSELLDHSPPDLNILNSTFLI